MIWANHFLRSLSDQDLELIRQDLTRIELNRDEVLAEVGGRVRFAILPANSIVSVVAVMRDGRSIESRTIGRESGFGLLHALGSRFSAERVLVQVSGEAHQIPLAVLAKAAQQSPSMLDAIARHAQATIVQAAQGTACNTLHGAEHRLCRWLLMTQDRLGIDVVPLTQEHLAIMLGVQRTTVTMLAQQLQSKGAISYARGRIRIIDRKALIACTCECYGAMTQAVAQILSDDGQTTDS
jgi:CRP-like cAMP-binding protein